MFHCTVFFPATRSARLIRSGGKPKSSSTAGTCAAARVNQPLSFLFLTTQNQHGVFVPGRQLTRRQRWH